MRKIKLGLSALGIIAGLAGGIKSCEKINLAQGVLIRDPSYIEQRRLETIASNINSSASSLNYTPSRLEPRLIPNGNGGFRTVLMSVPAKYPDAADARSYIESALSSLGDYQNVDDQLVHIRNALPDRNNIRGQTFQGEISQIRSLANVINAQATLYADKVPTPTLQNRNSGILFLVGSTLVGLTAAGFGAYVLYNKERDSRRQ